MRIGPIAENLWEWLAIRLRLGPRPLLETHGTLLLAQSVMVATRLGVFEALAGPALTAAEVARRCGTDERATAKLLGVLRATGYVAATGGDRYALTPDARRWLLADGETSLRDNVLFRFVEWPWIGVLESFVSTGAPLDIHREMSGPEWDAYQRGMRSLAGAWVGEVAWRTPVPRAARAMLDVGGAHGLYSAALCRRHPALRSVILELPEAVEAAAVMLAGEGVEDRVVHRSGDARTADLGASEFDLVFVSNLLHHFEPAQSRDLIRRAARALRPGGMLVIQELFALAPRSRPGQVAALAELYFALTSRSGSLSAADVRAWQKVAGLEPHRPIRFVSFPGAGQQSARKPRL
jgi:SAM-dependent methyltransferase